MRSSMRQQMHQKPLDPMFNMDYHNQSEREGHQTSLDVANEFGVTSQEIKILKNKLSRN